MSKMEIYDPAMCCSTGVCGPSIDPELIRVAAVIESLKNAGIVVERHNLSSDPQAFMFNKIVNAALDKNGVDILPMTLVDGKTVKTGTYPTNEEFANFLGISAELISAPSSKENVSNCGCGPKECC